MDLEAERLRCRVKAQRQRTKTLAWIDTLKVRCDKCGYSKCKSALDFHHRDKTTKVKSVSQMGTYSRAAILAEIAKCTVLCANCHREVEVNGR